MNGSDRAGGAVTQAPENIGPIVVGHASRACGKTLSEDFFDLSHPSAASASRRGVIAALADGVSSPDGYGRRAAETCVRAVVGDFHSTPARWSVAQALDRLIESVNAWLVAHNGRASDGRSMLSTLSVLVLDRDACCIAHVGDTRIYRLRGGACECLTRDHVWPRRDMRHVLRRAVGLDEHLAVDYVEDRVEAGDLYLLVSDGVWEVLGDAGLRDAVAPGLEPQAIADALVHRSCERQRAYFGRNDATAAVLGIGAPPPA